MKVSQVIKILKGLHQNAPIIMFSDAEGNEIHPLARIEIDDFGSPILIPSHEDFIDEGVEYPLKKNPRSRPGVLFDSEEDAGDALLDHGGDANIWWEDIGMEGGVHKSMSEVEVLKYWRDTIHRLTGVSTYGLSIDRTIQKLVRMGFGVYDSDTRTLVWFPDTMKRLYWKARR